MSSQIKKIKKIHRERKRFLKTLPLNASSEWLFELAGLKDFLFRESSFQIVGPQVYFEISKHHLADGPRMMLEVVGIPMLFEHNSLELVDQESCEVLIHKLEGDLFHTDLNELMQIGQVVYSSLEKTLYKSDSTKLCEVFHIVYNNEKIELHFFSQKDYIQKRF